MTANFKKTFGYCIIPKGTFLFRGHLDEGFQDCMFFALKFWVAGAFNDSVQVWRTTSEVEIIFLIESVSYKSWTESALPRLYNTVFPDESLNKYDDLDIKHRDIERRNRLIKALNSEYGLLGWLTSLENAIELEICLFYEKGNQIELIEIVNKDSQKYYKDSLKQLEIFPTQDFYKKTYIKLRNRLGEEIDKNDIWKRYQKYMISLIKEVTMNRNDIIRKKEQFSNLRTRLKI